MQKYQQTDSKLAHMAHIALQLKADILLLCMLLYLFIIIIIIIFRKIIL